MLPHAVSHSITLWQCMAIISIGNMAIFYSNQAFNFSIDNLSKPYYKWWQLINLLTFLLLIKWNWLVHASSALLSDSKVTKPNPKNKSQSFYEVYKRKEKHLLCSFRALDLTMYGLSVGYSLCLFAETYWRSKRA